ncbi:hypothetical protein NITLEN_10865 [Nitrospira lenta]|uniref:Uncharacterized protein n=1 Tax=Nitrospira lenta TaxID=1436998 RepID=A0A330L3K8_9BACT|nr:hypothetical protein NITLEN_10865 [Nitrospira lenta]
MPLLAWVVASVGEEERKRCMMALRASVRWSAVGHRSTPE